MIIANYKDYQAMIISRAMAWSQVTGWDLDEMVSEGNVAFCKATQTFKPDKGAAFGTYLFIALNTHYHNMLSKSRFMKAEKVASEDSAFCPSRHNTEQEGMFWAIIGDLPKDAKEVVKAILETPAEIIEVLGVTKVSRNAIFQYFTRFRGWTQSQVWSAFKSIKENFHD